MNNRLLKILSSALNAVLALDPESASRLKKLQHKTVTIELLPFHFIFQCLFTPQGAMLHSGENHPAGVRITGTPLAMLGMMLNKDHRQTFFAEDILMQGNAELGAEVVELFDALQIDWEEPLSKLIGDVPTYYASRVMQSISQWLGHIDDSMAKNVTEYLQEELGFLPPREALQDLFNDIDVLRMDVERIEARIAQLMEKLH